MRRGDCCAVRTEARSRTTSHGVIRPEGVVRGASDDTGAWREARAATLSFAPVDPRPTAVYLEPCALLHEAVAHLLRRIGVRLVTATGSPETALELLQLHHPELFLLELETSGCHELDPAECLRRACETDPRLTAVVLSSRDEGDWAPEARRLGASAYLPKSARPRVIEETIAGALEKARCGEPLWSTLTRREQEILELVSGDRTNAQVGRLLWVSPDTVKFHLANVYRKLSVTGRSEAARWARMHAPAPRARITTKPRVASRRRASRPAEEAPF